MSTWDDLLAVTHPGTEVEVPTTGERWLVLRRSYQHAHTDPLREDYADPLREDYMTITVELVRSGSPADPREIPPPRFFPPATPPREDTRP